MEAPAGVAGAVTPGGRARATLLLYGFRQPGVAPMHAGVSADELKRRFVPRGWVLDRSDKVPAAEVGIRVRRVDRMFELWRYQLRREEATRA